MIDQLIGPVTWALQTVLGNNNHDDNDNNNNNKEKNSNNNNNRQLADDEKNQSKSTSRQSPNMNDDTNTNNDNDEKKQEHSEFHQGDNNQQHTPPTSNNNTSSQPISQSSSSSSTSAAAIPQSQSPKYDPEQLQQRERVKTFLKRARAAYGRTALCLSGGGMMGCYHFGTIRALMEQNVLPHIISGTSAGSVVASMICTRSDEEIKRDLQPEVLVHRMLCFSKSWPDRLKNVYHNGHLFDNEEWIKLISWFTCGDMTFEEAYRKTGRILCITLSATTKKAPPVLVNYITAPDVTIASGKYRRGKSEKDYWKIRELIWFIYFFISFLTRFPIFDCHYCHNA